NVEIVQAVQIASDLKSEFFRTKSKKSCAGFLSSARTQIVSEFQIRLSIERNREHAKRIGPARLLLPAADHDGGSGRARVSLAAIFPDRSRIGARHGLGTEMGSMGFGGEKRRQSG